MKLSFFLAFIISIDIYFASAAYRNSGIKIPLSSAAVISFIGAAVLGTSLKFSYILSSFIPASVSHFLSVGILTLIGVLTIFKSLVRTLTKKISKNGELSMKMGKSPIILKLYLDETTADFDNSKTLSPAEATALALSCSFDAAAVGISSGSLDIEPLFASLFAVLWGFSAFILGTLTGKKISSLNKELSWISGVLLILFAVFV